VVYVFFIFEQMNANRSFDVADFKRHIDPLKLRLA
jgi:hypothetical protein